MAIEIPGTITKEEISTVRGHVGRINAEDVELGGQPYPAGSLKFLGFKGSPDASGAELVFRGVFRYGPPNPEDRGRLAPTSAFPRPEDFGGSGKPSPLTQEEADDDVE